LDSAFIFHYFDETTLFWFYFLFHIKGTIIFNPCHFHAGYTPKFHKINLIQAGKTVNLAKSRHGFFLKKASL